MNSFFGFAGHIAEGHFNVSLLIYTTVAVIFASQVGAMVMKEKMEARWIKQIFGFILLFVSIKLAWKIFL